MLGACPRWCRAVLGWEHGPWDVAASLGYVACDKSGLARAAELAAVWRAAGWAAARTFRKEERGERVRLLSLSRGCSPCLCPAGGLGVQGQLLLTAALARGRGLQP